MQDVMRLVRLLEAAEKAVQAPPQSKAQVRDIQTALLTVETLAGTRFQTRVESIRSTLSALPVDSYPDTVRVDLVGISFEAPPENPSEPQA